MWVLVFFSVLSVGLYRVVSSQINVVRRMEYGYCGSYLAKAAVVYASQERKVVKNGYATLYELGRVRERELGRGKFRYSFVDEQSKININTAPAEVIARLPGLDRELAGKIIDSPLRPFHVKEELLLIEGIDETAFSVLREFITVYGEGRVNLNTVSAGTMEVLGFDEALAAMIVRFRQGADGAEGTEDDGFFENSGEIISSLQSTGGLSSSQEAVLADLIGQGNITTASQSLALKIDTEVLQRPAMKYSIVLEGEKIKEWREY
jgi:DNA uptake protein ComE-like DNA-binding protein